MNVAGRFRTFAWVGAIALGAGLASYLARPAGRTALDVKRSSFRTTPDGVAAFARGLERFGRPAAPRLTPLADAGPLPGALVLLSSRARWRSTPSWSECAAEAPSSTRPDCFRPSPARCESRR